MGSCEELMKDDNHISCVSSYNVIELISSVGNDATTELFTSWS